MVESDNVLTGRWLLLAFALLLWLPGSAQAGVAHTDTADFLLDTTDTPNGIGGIAYADSADFTLDTTGTAGGVGGVAYADSADFTLDTTGTAGGVGGVAYADSADFTLDTTGTAGGVGGVAYADSADFPLNTQDALDIGLRIQDGAITIHIACEPAGTLTSPLRIHKNGTTYGIILVDPGSPDASPIRVQTSSGIKALKKLP